jgi:putative methionine-R-sulfoxide reductase with GAF domain
MPASPSSGFSRDTSKHLSDSNSSEFNDELFLIDIAERALRSTGASGVAIALRDGEDFVCRAAVGETAPSLGIRLDGNNGITGDCIRSARAITCDDVREDSRVNLAACESLGVNSIVAVPISKDGEVIGVLEALARTPAAFGSATVNYLEKLATKVASQMALQNADTSAGDILEQKEVHRGPVEIEEFAEPTELSETAEENVEFPVDEQLFSFEDEPLSLRIRRHGTLLKRTFIGVMLALAGTMIAYWAIQERKFAAPVTPTTTSDSTPSPGPTAPGSADAARELPATSANDLKSVQLAAEAGDRISQLRLAVALAEGTAIPKDVVGAHAWNIMANRNTPANLATLPPALNQPLTDPQVAQVRLRVAQMFENAIGARKDLTSAFYWLILAESAGSTKAREEQQRLSKAMDENEIATARTRARAWLAQHRKKPA